MKYPFHHNANSRLFGAARGLRKRETQAEKILWEHLRGRQQQGRKFRRQHPVGPYIVDFYCHECLLVVEADGDIHQQDDNPSYDEERTAFLNHAGIWVLRFTNAEVLHELDNVLNTIRNALDNGWTGFVHSTRSGMP